MFLLLIFTILALGIAFLICGIRTFNQVRKYYKSLVDFNICEVDFHSEESEKECIQK